MEVSNIVAGTLLRANPFKGAHLSPSNSRFRVRDNNAPWAEEEVGILKQCLQPCSTGIGVQRLLVLWHASKEVLYPQQKFLFPNSDTLKQGSQNNLERRRVVTSWSRWQLRWYRQLPPSNLQLCICQNCYSSADPRLNILSGLPFL